MATFLLIDKPETWTSHDVVGYLRRVTGEKKIGHAGTLDPFATGLLIVGVGRAATKQLDHFKQFEKEYVATITLGATSDTADSTGTIQTTPNCPAAPTDAEVTAILHTFLGTQEQVPPMYSAKKIAGERLYTLARQGVTVERKPNTITIGSITLLSYTYPEVVIRVRCSTGTYVRTLAEDIGKHLGHGGYCSTLRRTQIGAYSVEKAKNPQDLAKDTWKDQAGIDVSFEKE